MGSRRAFVRGAAGLGGLAVLSACGGAPAWFQQKRRVTHVAYVTTVGVESDATFAAFRGTFNDLGYHLGTDLLIEHRSAEGHVERLPAIIEELLNIPVDVLATAATPAAAAAKAATSTTPIVFTEVNDPVGQGLVASLARPGANVTGVSTLSGALSSKRVELLKEVLPGLTRVALLWNAANGGMVLAHSQTEAAAATLGVTTLSHGVHTNEEVPGALEDILGEQPDAMIMEPAIGVSPVTLVQEFAARRRLPVIYSDRQPVDAGGLMGLGPNYAELNRRAAAFVDRILHGARPADLPVEQPSQFDFVVNLKVAEALGLAIPQSVLLQATDTLR